MSACAQSNDELFQKIFGKKQIAKQIVLPLVYEKKYLGEIKSFVKGSDQITKISLDDFLMITDGMLITEVYQILQKRLKRSKFITLEELKEEKIIVIFDYRELNLTLHVPIEMLKEKSSSVTSYDIPHWAQSKKVIEPAPFSHYHNLSSYKNFNISNSDAEFTQNIDSNIHIGEFNIENKLTYEQSEKHKWQREETRLIKDFVPSENRLIIGDLRPGIKGHMSYVDNLGLQLSKDQEINPYRIVNPENKTSFTLKSKSNVDVYVNNFKVRTITLEPGKHELKNLPLSQGINDIKLVIEDFKGHKEILYFSQSFSTDLLKKDDQLYSYSLGKVSTEVDGLKKYDNNFIASMYHYYGATDKFTFGGFGQANKTNELLGGELIATSLFGDFNYLSTFSKYSSKHVGTSQKLSYRFTTHGKSRRTHSLMLSAEYFSPCFMTITDNSCRYMRDVLTMSYNMPVLSDLSALFSASSTIHHQDDLNTPYSLGASINKSFRGPQFKGLTTNLQLLTRRTESADAEHTLTFNLSYHPVQSKNSWNYNYGSRDNNQSLSWHYKNAKTSHEENHSLSYTSNENVKSLRGTQAVSHQLFNAKINENFDHRVGGENSSNLGVSFNTAIVGANSNVSISRPVYSSFAIMPLDNEIKDEVLYINRSGQNYLAKNYFGIIVLPNLSSYYYFKADLDTRQVPIGITFDDEEYIIHSGHKTGAIAKIKAKAFLSVVGNLKNLNGAPYKYATGRLVSDGKSYEFFTNKNGQFFIEAMSKGTYRIEIDGVAQRAVISVDRASGVYNAGIIEI